MMYKVAAITHPGPGVENQDNFFCNGIYKKSLTEQTLEIIMQTSSKNHNVYAVFDGIGGLHNGGVAALVACEALFEACMVNASDVGEALFEADSSVMMKSIEIGLKMGSTCVIVEEKAERFRAWNMGDSRAYYYSEGELIQISRDHTEAENARIIQGITGEAFQIPSKYEHILTQYLGADKSIYAAEPYASDWISRRIGDKFLLCSDGLYKFVDDRTMQNIINGVDCTLDKCRNLIETALANNAKDNITAVLIEDEH